eukprot:CAMPEP_0176144948 /NCGR_PEP_ID=MMETSP0120_2-20121206/73813_1 /TAXON_ID=160619 /ORGANISM="Kryptoperidinium foliaceum, Strain CCMP 1326" /LENGTH=98 /DNA_ID=CAMNT_0017481359 /DNA_START=20 /DNA_END=313 /DNA_ORIENTATION=+
MTRPRMFVDAGRVRSSEALVTSAESAVSALTDHHIDEIRSLRHPPLVVRRLLEVVFFLLHAARPNRRSIAIQAHVAPWPRVHALLHSPDFRERLVSYD